MFALLIGVLGLVVGTALALIAERVPDNGGGGRSPRHCRTCETELPARSLAPVRSAATACSNCGTPVPASRLPTVLTTAVVFALTAGVIGSRWQLIPVLLFASSLIALSVVDIVRYRLPDRLTFPAFGLSIVLIAVLSTTGGAGDHILRALVTALGYAGIMLIFNIIMPSGLAFGDVKLSLLLGLFLGWVADSSIDAARLVIWALLLGMVLGIVSGILVGVGRRVYGNGFLPDPDFPPPEDGSVLPLLKTAFPFGPALAISAFSLVLLSERLTSAGILA